MKSHRIGHELTALHGIDHARTLSVVLPHLLWNQREAKREKLLQFGDRVWGITDGDETTRIAQSIQRMVDVFASLNVPTSLAELDDVDPDTVTTIVQRFEARGWTDLGERSAIGPSDVRTILEQSLAGRFGAVPA